MDENKKEETACTHSPGSGECEVCTLQPGDTSSRNALPRRTRTSTEVTPKIPSIGDARGRWIETKTYCRVWESGDLVLMVMIGHENLIGFLVMALEMRNNIGPMADHAHKQIGIRKTAIGAKRMAERFAAEWIRTRSKSDSCPCEEIGTTLTPPTRPTH